MDRYQRGNPTIYVMTVRCGDAVWHIQRRFKQVWTLHSSLSQVLKRSGLQLPQPPPRTTVRSGIFGQKDGCFLEKRGKHVERYLASLLKMIPYVDQCEALYKFLCYTNLRSWDYGSMVGGGAPPVDPAAVAALPKVRTRSTVAPAPASVDGACVICQDPMQRMSMKEDVRVLPCGHEFHFRCISRWLMQRNTCCVCNGPAVPTAPRLSLPGGSF